MICRFFWALPLFTALLLILNCSSSKNVITVGSKPFTESYVLSEIIAQIIEDTGEATVVRRFGLGATGIIYEALLKGEVDIYSEYSGTVSEAILKNPQIKTIEDLQRALVSHHLMISEPLGFNNTYALALRRQLAEEKKIENISDLGAHPEVVVGFSHEFMKRTDGFPGLQTIYGLKFKSVQAMQHTLAYQAIGQNKIDMTDVYSTDAEIENLKLKILKDDKKFFPDYLALILARDDFKSRFPKSWEALKQLTGAFNEKDMIHLNAEAEIEKKDFAVIASEFLSNRSVVKKNRSEMMSSIWRFTKQHCNLVLTSLLFSILVGIPLGVVASQRPVLGQIILIVSGVLQTIPSLALLCFLIPFFGIGTVPSLVALFLYGLLPIVLGTFTGIKTIDPRLIESSVALGLSKWQRMRLIEVPLAFPQILAGIKTSTIINIGTATLAALIGAGGYGSPIITGLALNDMNIVLQGAIPAALMALVAHGLFEIIERNIRKY